MEKQKTTRKSFGIIKKMVWLFRAIKSDISNPQIRFLYYCKVTNPIIGSTGSLVRCWLLRKYLKHIGHGCQFWGDITIYSPEKLSIGDNVGFAKGLHIQAAGTVTIGNDCMFGPFVKIWSRDHVYNDPATPINRQGYIYHPVIIGNDVWVGTDVFIMPGVEIGDHSIVAAGAVVNRKKYPPFSIIAGNPARKIGHRRG